MEIKNINIGDKVLYIPHHLLIADKDKMIVKKNLGIVTSKNERYVFVRYLGNNHSQATYANDLFSLNNRPDLAELLNE